MKDFDLYLKTSSTNHVFVVFHVSIRCNYLLLPPLQVRLQQLGRPGPVPGRSGRAPLGQGLRLVRLLALVVVLVFLLVVVMVLVVLGVLGKLVILVRLLLELPDLQTPQVDKEEKTGPHRHEQVPLLGLHVCCGGEGGRERRWWWWDSGRREVRQQEKEVKEGVRGRW